MRCLLKNESKNEVLVGDLEIAKTPWKRMRGLLGRKGLEEGKGLLIEDCRSIHTWFMGFAIDVVYVDEELRVRKLVPELGPWRFSSSRGSAHVLEIPAGSAATHRVEVSDRLKIEAAEDASPAI